jgi:hypothetical protein
MARTTTEDIKRWLNEAKSKHTHVIVVCDTFDYEDYPVYVAETENVHEIFDKCNKKSMQRVIEVYNLKLDIEAQLKEHRAKNF